MTKLLVQNGASLLKPKKDGMNILHASASFNDIHILDFAIRNKETKSIDIPNQEVIKFYLSLGTHTCSHGLHTWQYGLFKLAN